MRYFEDVQHILHRTPCAVKLGGDHCMTADDVEYWIESRARCLSINRTMPLDAALLSTLEPSDNADLATP